MEQAENFMKLTVSAKAENIALARLAVASFAAQLEFTISDLEELKVVVSEIVSNSIIHGYQEGEGLVDITAYHYPSRLILIIEDQGVGIADVELAKEAAYTTKEGRMGLGLSFVQSFMDQVQITSSKEQGTKLVMTKYLGQTAH